MVYLQHIIMFFLQQIIMVYLQHIIMVYLQPLRMAYLHYSIMVYLQQIIMVYLQFAHMFSHVVGRCVTGGFGGGRSALCVRCFFYALLYFCIIVFEHG